MVIKKKLEYFELQGWHWFIPFFIMPCVLLFVLFSSNSYAMTSDELDNYVSLYLSKLSENYPTQAIEFQDLYNQKKQYYYDTLAYDSDINRVVLRAQTNGVYFINLANSTAKCRYYGTGSQILAEPIENETRGYYYYTGSINIQTSSVITQTSINNVWLRTTGSSLIGTNFILWNQDFTNETDLSSYFYMDSSPQNSITLTATSHSKFNFTDFNQCVVDITGDWEFGDFTYYVERLIDNEWNRWTSLTDWHFINGYENPYYVIWHNINYFPVGTYRYCADYGNTGEQLYYSNEFQITQSVIDNSASGTIDNGNIDIDIDTGKTVDDLKDYLGSPADFDNTTITQEDIENAININETVNPYDNFVLTFINGLTSALTGNSHQNWTFKVHSWGQTFTFSPSDIIPPYSEGLTQFLSIISTTFCVILIVKWVTQIVEAINVGDISKSLELIEEKYSDLL